MVNSYNFIEKKMSGDVMHGFTKVGENTFPNVIPMLTGRSFITEHNNQFDVRKQYDICDKIAVFNSLILYKQSMISNNNSNNLIAYNVYDNFLFSCTHRTGRTYGRTLVRRVPRLFMLKTSQNSTCLTILLEGLLYSPLCITCDHIGWL